MPRVVTLL
ncbi:hypothetical protein D049_3692A, partial [Vibrio parahaemolyticus VPTS-2010]